jgi:hypothetical protein
MDLVEFGLMMRIFLSAGTILSFASMILKIEDRIKVVLEKKFLQRSCTIDSACACVCVTRYK